MAGAADVDAAVAAARGRPPGWAGDRRVRAGRGAATHGRRGGRPAPTMLDPGAQRRPGQAAGRSPATRWPSSRSTCGWRPRTPFAWRAALPPSVDSGRRVLLQRVPLGVAGIIVPWNWPYTMAAELFAPALAAGNAVVWLAAPTTARLLGRAGVGAQRADDGPAARACSNFLNGAGPVAGDALAGHPGVDAVAFIGSVATGRSVAARAAGKAQILELGGNGPLVVLDDADLDGGRRRRSSKRPTSVPGQSCTAGERILVHRGDPGRAASNGSRPPWSSGCTWATRSIRRHDDGPAQQRGRGGQDRRARRGGRGGRGPGRDRRAAGGRDSRPICSGSRPCSTASRRRCSSPARRRSARWLPWSRWPTTPRPWL